MKNSYFESINIEKVFIEPENIVSIFKIIQNEQNAGIFNYILPILQKKKF
jgi:hypothetical protein